MSVWNTEPNKDSLSIPETSIPLSLALFFKLAEYVLGVAVVNRRLWALILLWSRTVVNGLLSSPVQRWASSATTRSNWIEDFCWASATRGEDWYVENMTLSPEYSRNFKISFESEVDGKERSSTLPIISSYDRQWVSDHKYILIPAV